MESLEKDDRDCLSDSHRDFLMRYIQAEHDRQEKVSEAFLRERFKGSAAASKKHGEVNQRRCMGIVERL